MQELIAFVKSPFFWTAVKLFIGYFGFMAAVSALPDPTPTMSQFHWYRIAFVFLHSFSANFNRAAVALKLPGAIDQGGQQ